MRWWPACRSSRPTLPPPDSNFRAVVYEGAKHAFFNDTNASTYDEAAATDSWQQSIAFLERQLG